MSAWLMIPGAWGLASAVLVFFWWSDRRWYKNHPGAKERFGKIDDELAAHGE